MTLSVKRQTRIAEMYITMQYVTVLIVGSNLLAIQSYHIISAIKTVLTIQSHAASVHITSRQQLSYDGVIHLSLNLSPRL